MFERSLVVSQRSHASAQQRWTTVASLTLQVSVAAVVIAIPLFRQELPALKIEAPKAFVQLKPPPPIKPVQMQSRAASAAPSTPSPVPVQSAVLLAPTSIPPLINSAPDDAPPRMFTGGNSGMSNALTGLGDVASTTSRVVAVTEAPVAKRPTISSGVSTGMLLAPIRPVYPPIAKATHTEGRWWLRRSFRRQGGSRA